jgi:hypothetical protein
MFDKVSQVAEKLATNVSRRAFLGRLGKGALVLAGAMGAILAFPALGQAKGCAGTGGGLPPPCYDCKQCIYACPDGTSLTHPANKDDVCNGTYKGCLISWCL